MKTLSMLLFAIIFGMYVLPIVAMPTQKEIDEARSFVRELMRPHVEKLRAKSMSATEVGDKAMEYASNADADMQGAKFLFLKGASAYYVQGKAYDKAADAIDAVKEQFADIAPETLLEITTRATKGVSPKTAPRLFALHGEAEMQAKNAKALQAVVRELKNRPGDAALIRSQAELTAAAGKWDEALKIFAKLEGGIGKIAQEELDGVANAATLADFWWSYTPHESSAKKAMSQRAVMHYRTAIDNGMLDGLKKMLAEQRIAEGEDVITPSKDAVGKNEADTRNRKKTPGLKPQLRKGMVGYWPFDGDAKDASGSRNNGTAHNVQPTEDRYGNVNGAFQFNGSGYIEVPHSHSLNMVKAFTVTAWIKPQNWDQHCIAIIQKGDLNRAHYQFQIIDHVKYKRVLCIGEDLYLRCADRIEMNGWQHVALVYEHGKNMRYYHDGVLVGQLTSVQKMLPQNDDSLLIGKDPYGGVDYFNGDMDDVRLFNRALSEKEIQELYKVEFAGVDS